MKEQFKLSTETQRKGVKMETHVTGKITYPVIRVVRDTKLGKKPSEALPIQYLSEPRKKAVEEEIKYNENYHKEIAQMSVNIGNEEALWVFFRGEKSKDSSKKSVLKRDIVSVGLFPPNTWAARKKEAEAKGEVVKMMPLPIPQIEDVEV